ncbi:MAG: acetyl-CoA C-acetyltransferase [Spirochaetota bacterium]
MEEVVILEGARTAFGSFGGSLAKIGATELGKIASQEAVAKSGVSVEDIEECIFGNVIQSEKNAAYLARHIALHSGLSQTTPALTLNRLCGSGMESILQASRQIRCGEAEVILAGGVESMSQAPFVVRDARWGVKYGHSEFEDTLFQGLIDMYVDLPMGATAENLAKKYQISREEQDEWACTSQERAEAATNSGILREEMVAVEISGKNPISFATDEFIKGSKSREKIGKLRPVFQKEGSVTAGNASGINDGASAVVVSSASFAQKSGKKPLAKVIGYAYSGCDPKIMGIGPALAVPKALKAAGLQLRDMQRIEINEAFAAQYLAVEKELGLDPEITNVNGGAIAIGHPLGASGNRVVLTLAYELRRKQLRYGLASLCIGGGQGIAMVLENPSYS